MIYIESKGELHEFLGKNIVLTILIAILAVFLVLYLLQSFATYKMAKNRQFKKLYLAFIPFVRYYTLGKLAGTVKIGGKCIRNIGIAFAIITTLSLLLQYAQTGLSYGEIAVKCLQGKDIIITEVDGKIAYEGISGKLFEISNYLTYPSLVFSILTLVMNIMVFAALYRCYNPRHYIMLTIFTLFGFTGICLMTVRNKKFVDYNEYIKAKYEAFQRQFKEQAEQDPNRYRPYGDNTQKGNTPPYDPFDPFRDNDGPVDTNNQAQSSDPFGMGDNDTQPQQKDVDEFDPFDFNQPNDSNSKDLFEEESKKDNTDEDDIF